MIWKPGNCCGCFSLRVGSLILSSLSIGIAGIILLISIFGFIGVDQSIIEACHEMNGKNYFHDVNDCITYNTPISHGLLITSIVHSALHATFSVVFIVGVVKNQTRLLIPYIVWILLDILLIMCVTIAAIVLYALSGAPVMAILVAVVMAAVIFLLTYFLLVLRAYYHQMKNTHIIES